MHPTPVVERDMQGDSSTVGADLLGVGVGPPSIPAQVHPHGQVPPLNMVRRGLAEIGIAPHSNPALHWGRFAQCRGRGVTMASILTSLATRK